MPECKQCKNTVSDTARYCQYCGSALSEASAPHGAAAPADTKSPSGIGGWLILVDISVMLSTVSHIVSGISYIRGANLLFSALEIALSVYCILCLIFMVYKSRHFPAMCIGMVCANVGAGLFIWLINYGAWINIAYVSGRILGGLLAIGVFAAYLLRSKPVKKTFVN